MKNMQHVEQQYVLKDIVYKVAAIFVHTIWLSKRRAQIYAKIAFWCYLCHQSPLCYLFIRFLNRDGVEQIYWANTQQLEIILLQSKNKQTNTCA